MFHRYSINRYQHSSSINYTFTNHISSSFDNLSIPNGVTFSDPHKISQRDVNRKWVSKISRRQIHVECVTLPRKHSFSARCQRSLSSRFLFSLMRVSFLKNVITDNILSRALSVSLPLSSCRRRSMFCPGRQSSFFVVLGYRASSSSQIHTIQCSFSLPQQTGIRSYTERAHTRSIFIGSQSTNGVREGVSTLGP
jgi:hypothetical protein